MASLFVAKFDITKLSLNNPCEARTPPKPEITKSIIMKPLNITIGIQDNYTIV